MKEGTRSGGSNEEGCEPQSNQAVVSTDSGRWACRRSSASWKGPSMCDKYMIKKCVQLPTV